MSQVDQIILCDGCGVEVFWGPVVVGKRRYCCADCADGRECECGERIDQEDEKYSHGGELAASR